MASIQILSGECRGCGGCIDACPFGAIRMEAEKAVVLETCTLCGACVSSCAFEAIEIQKEEAAAAPVGTSTGQGVWVFGEQQAGLPASVALELLGEGGSSPEPWAFPFPPSFWARTSPRRQKP